MSDLSYPRQRADAPGRAARAGRRLRAGDAGRRAGPHRSREAGRRPPRGRLGPVLRVPLHLAVHAPRGRPRRRRARPHHAPAVTAHGVALASLWMAIPVAVGAITWAVADLIRDPGRGRAPG